MSEFPESHKQRCSAKAIDNPELPKLKKTPTPNSHRPQASHCASKVLKPTQLLKSLAMMMTGLPISSPMEAAHLDLNI